MVAVQPQRHRVDVLNLRDHIAQQLRAAVLSGTFKPGERLVEVAIAEQLGVSHAPVREALSALERDGILVSTPRRGYSIIDFTDKDIEEIYTLRSVLEIGAARRVVERLTPALIAALQGCVDEMGDAIEQKQSFPILASKDLAFHELLCRSADHRRLYSTWDTMRVQTWMLIGLTSRTHVDQPERQKETHQCILDALSARELARVETMLGEHFLDAQRRARRALQELRANDTSLP